MKKQKFIKNEPKNPKATVVILHGFKSSAKKYRKTAEQFYNHGYKCIRFNFTGHNEEIAKTGLTPRVKQAKKAIEHAKEPVLVFGSSLGGLIAVIASAENNKVKALALRSPVTKFELGIKNKIKKKNHILLKPHGIKCKKRFLQDAKKYNAAETIKKVKAPLLIVHGTKDKKVPLKGTKWLIQAANEPKKLVKINAGHLFNKEQWKKTTELAANWFDAHLD